MQKLSYLRHMTWRGPSQNNGPKIARIQSPVIRAPVNWYLFGSDLPGGRVDHTKTMAATLTLFLLPILCGSVFSQQPPSAPIVFKGPTMGAVSFPHSAHTRVAGKCEVCHHASKPEKSL